MITILPFQLLDRNGNEVNLGDTVWYNPRPGEWSMYGAMSLILRWYDDEMRLALCNDAHGVKWEVSRDFVTYCERIDPTHD